MCWSWGGNIGWYAKLVHHTRSTSKDIVQDNTEGIERIDNIIRSKQATASQPSYAASWIRQKAWINEHENICSNAYVGIEMAEVPRDANGITAHVADRIKTTKSRSSKTNTRIVDH